MFVIYVDGAKLLFFGCTHTCVLDSFITITQNADTGIYGIKGQRVIGRIHVVIAFGYRLFDF